MKKKTKSEKNKVKDEFLLSVIFVGKWLALGIGSVAIVYASIFFAYNKIYYDPLVKEIEIKISDLVSIKNDKEAISKLTTITTIENKKIIDSINNIDLPEIEKKLNEINAQIESLGESLLDKAKFWGEKSKKHNELYVKKDALLNDRQALTNKAEELNDDNEEKYEDISKLSKKIKELNIKIAEEEREIEKIGTGGPGMWTWFATFALGITL